MNENKFILDIKNNQYFSLKEAQDFLTFNIISPTLFLVIENDKKFLVERNEVFLFNKNYYLFINLEEKISLFSSKIMDEKLFLLLTQNFLQFFESQINNGVIFFIFHVFIKKLIKYWKVLILIILFSILFQQKQYLSFEDESYTNKYQLKKNIYAVYKDVIRNAQYEKITDSNLPSIQKADIYRKKIILDNNKIKSDKKRVEKVKEIEHEPDIDLFLKLKKMKRK